MTRTNSLRIVGAIKDKVFTGPRTVSLHATNYCNIDCSYCWYHSELIKEHEKPRREIDFDVFKDIVDDCADLGTDNINISGEGEPFLHPKIREIISYIKSKNMKLGILTNGTFLKSHIEAAMKTDWLAVNLSATSPETYQALQFKRSGDMFYRIIDNLDKINKLKKKIRGPSIRIIYIITQRNYKEIDKMIKLAHSLGVDQINYKLMSATSKTKTIVIKKESLGEFKQIMKRAMALEETYGKFTNLDEVWKIIERSDFIESDRIVDYGIYDRNFYYSKDVQDIKCYIGWFHAHIDIRGYVFPCCENQNFIVGNIYKRRFKDIWCSHTFHKARLEGKHNFDLTKKEWQECHYCPSSFIQLNKKVHSQMKTIKQSVIADIKL